MSKPRPGRLATSLLPDWFLPDRMYSNCTGPFFTVHSDITMPYISNYGSKEQVERFIPEMTAGRCIAAIAMTEPGAGRSGSREGSEGAAAFIRSVPS